jgi:hypothetical protein
MRDALSMVPIVAGWIALPVLWFKVFRKKDGEG